jgi:hypothetical protein
MRIFGGSLAKSDRQDCECFLLSEKKKLLEKLPETNKDKGQVEDKTEVHIRIATV